MADIIRMPLLSDTMEEGTIVSWNKKVGDSVEAGDVLAEVETDKAVMEVESYYDGELLYIGVEAGNAVPVDAIIAIIGEKGEDYKAILQEEKSNGQAKKEDKKEESSEAGEVSKKEDKKPEPELVEMVQTSSGTSDKRIKASPLAKKMAKDVGVDIAKIKGSGDGGRVIKRDVVNYSESKPAEVTGASSGTSKESTAEVIPFSLSVSESYEEENISQMRKTIARKLGESKFTAPHFYLTIEIDMAKAMEARQKINEVAPVKISFNDFIIKASAVALHQHPAVNSSWLGDKIRRNKHVHIGVAVAVQEGLLVPVVKHADHKSLSQLNTEVKVLAGKAKERKLSLEEMQGNTFTISNLGMFGIEEFTAIINPPDACIMAVGTIVEKPVVKDGAIVVGHRMKVTLSCDHRVVDGASGARFLETFKSLLEEPVRILV